MKFVGVDVKRKLFVVCVCDGKYFCFQGSGLFFFFLFEGCFLFCFGIFLRGNVRYGHVWLEVRVRCAFLFDYQLLFYEKN